MSRSSKARGAAAAAGALAFLAGAAAFLRGRRLRRGGSMHEIKEIARRLAEDPWRGRLDETLELVADDYVGYIPGSPEPTRGKDGFREFVSTYLTGFPDGAITVDELIAEGDVVATRWTGRGTHTGELLGIPPTGREVTVNGMSFTRIVGGKAREDWTTWDTLSMLQQLGAVPETATART